MVVATARLVVVAATVTFACSVVPVPVLSPEQLLPLPGPSLERIRPGSVPVHVPPTAATILPKSPLSSSSSSSTSTTIITNVAPVRGTAASIERSVILPAKVLSSGPASIVAGTVVAVMMMPLGKILLAMATHVFPVPPVILVNIVTTPVAIVITRGGGPVRVIVPRVVSSICVRRRSNNAPAARPSS